jgi:antitoxin component YwqK of YwqJK toxin-antitoxin module
MAKGNYKYDKQEGEYLSYYKNGHLWAKDIYKNGQLIETIKP